MARIGERRGLACLGSEENKRGLRGDRRVGNEEEGNMDGWDDLEMGLERKWREGREESEKGVVVAVEKEWKASIDWMEREREDKWRERQSLRGRKKGGVV